MNFNVNEFIHNEIKKIEYVDKNILFVLVGFPKNWLDNMELNKMFSISNNISLKDLYSQKPQLITEAVSKFNNDNSAYWCTMEEFLTAGEKIIEPFAEIKIIKNNFYENFFPLTYKIESLEEINKEYFEEIDRHKDIPEEYQYIVQYYGGFILTEQYAYVSYIEDYDNIIELFTVPEDELVLQNSENTSYFIELSEDEQPFIDTITNLLENKQHYDIIAFAWKGNITQFPQNYRDRIKLVKSFFSDMHVCKYQKRTTHKTTPRENDYKKILQKYWNYSDFRTLKMYKDVDDLDNPKQTTDISQAQIINDLVTQSENANNDNGFRDIFVTSPTGAGKSLMFQIPGIYLAENYNLVTIVISPLIGLMNDQVYSLHEKNVSMSATINSEISPVEKQNIAAKIENGDISILYISPETLQIGRAHV